MKPKKTIPKTAAPITPPAGKRNFLLRKIPLIYPLLMVLFFGVFIYIKFLKANRVNHSFATKTTTLPATNCFKLFRELDFPYTRPLVLYEREEESIELNPAKLNVSLLIDQLVYEKIILSASVYVSDLQNDKWFCINPSATFSPASLLKIPVLMIYLKESEKDPTILDTKIKFEKTGDFIPAQTFKSKTLIPGNYYTIKELFSYMIIHSDNNATHLLNTRLNVEAFQNLFISIGMKKPIMDDLTFSLSVFDYSKFFHILFNSTYLSHVNSNYALSLLAQCEFRDGMVSGLPVGIAVAHKFGESGNLARGGIREFHESGIIYTDKGPILITIFTKGENVNSLPSAISRITHRIYDNMQAAL